MFLFFKDLPAYGSEALVGWLTRRSLVDYYKDEVKAAKSFLDLSFTPPASLIGVRSFN